MKNWLEGIRVVFTKELIDNLRDRRSVMTALITTLITPTLLLTLIVVMGKTIFAEGTVKILELPVSGAEKAPTLIQFLKQNGVDILPAPADPQAEVRNGNYDVILIIPESYDQEFRSAQSATIQLVLDSSRQSASGSIERIGQLLDSFSTQVGELRLLARGVNPSILQTLAVESVDVATPQSKAIIFLNMMPFLLLITIFTGGMYVIIDTTAGERERSSLEPLLINPIGRWEFVLGKYGAALPFVTVTLAATLTAFGIGFNLIPMEEYIGARISIDVLTMVNIFLICLPIILLASALQMIVATFTHSFKEAQTYVGLMSFIPALPGAFLAFLPIKTELWEMFIPTFGQQLLINQLLRGEVINPVNILVSAIVTVLAAVLCVTLAIKLYEREQILFGTK